MIYLAARRMRASFGLADGLCAAGAVTLAATLTPGAGPAAEGSGVMGAALLAAIATPLSLARCGAYSVRRRLRLGTVLGPLARGASVASVIVLAGCSGFGLEGVPAQVVGLAAALLFGALALGRAAVIALVSALHRRDRDLGSFVVVGSGSRARKLAAEIEANPAWGLRNRGHFDDAPLAADARRLGTLYLGGTKELGKLLCREAIDEVFVVLPRRYLCSESTAELVALCEAVGVEVTVASDLFSTHRARPQPHDLLGVPAMTFSNYPHRSMGQLAVKRALDVVGAALGIVLFSPLLLVAAIAIKLDSPGPVLFRQQRCTLRGRRFPFLKLRTMVVDAERHLAELRARNEVSGPVFKMKVDPRVTRVGRFLRRFSIDELPQLLNVLVGHMSLVGPRPPIPGEVDQYDLSERRRLSIRPGLTCLWQVGGRSLIPFEEWVRLDLQYIDRWSLGLDLRILLRTVPAVIRGEGAS